MKKTIPFKNWIVVLLSPVPRITSYAIAAEKAPTPSEDTTILTDNEGVISENQNRKGVNAKGLINENVRILLRPRNIRRPFKARLRPYKMPVLAMVIVTKSGSIPRKINRIIEHALIKIP